VPPDHSLTNHAEELGCAARATLLRARFES